MNCRNIICTSDIWNALIQYLFFDYPINIVHSLLTYTYQNDYSVLKNMLEMQGFDIYNIQIRRRFDKVHEIKTQLG